jgi:hypothetical protein
MALLGGLCDLAVKGFLNGTGNSERRISMLHGKILRLTIFAILVLLAGCSNVKTLKGADLEAVLVYSEPKADIVFQGLNENRYATFSADFTADMKDAIDEQGLADIENMVVNKIGKYLSRQVDTVQTSGDFVTVTYKANFEQEEGVTVRLVFEKGGNHAISGLWFDSPKLREK